MQAKTVDGSVDAGAQVQQTVNFELIEEYSGTGPTSPPWAGSQGWWFIRVAKFGKLSYGPCS